MLVANLSDLRSFDLEEKQQICADFLSFPDHFETTFLLSSRWGEGSWRPPRWAWCEQRSLGEPRRMSKGSWCFVTLFKVLCSWVRVWPSIVSMTEWWKITVLIVHCNDRPARSSASQVLSAKKWPHRWETMPGSLRQQKLEILERRSEE